MVRSISRHFGPYMLAAPLIIAPAVAAGQSSSARKLAPAAPVTRAVRTAAPIHIDGRLDEPAWRNAPETTAFTQLDPEEGAAASEPTTVRVLYDDQALYIGARMADRGRIIGRLGRRDLDHGDSDWFIVLLDSYHDRRTAFGFEVNPAGVRRDEVRTVDQDDGSWDGVWSVATQVDSAGWTAEYRIPFSQLHFSRDSVQTWGVQFERIIGRLQEEDLSTFIPKRESGGVARYGLLEGLRDLRPGKRLELLPYTVARAEYVQPGLDPYRTGHDHYATAGLDLRYRVASNLTLNGTVNPDFGQVELDPAVVNLGVYETFFAEKRPFFLEGSEIFDFGANGTSGGRLFYSRRIGRAPTLGAPTPYADVPTSTTILGAGKLTGKVAGWSVGSLFAATAREDARWRDTAGIDHASPVEPASQYFVARARRELRGGRTILGGALTAVHRVLGEDALKANFRSSALAGGVDFRHEWDNRNWIVYGDAEASRIAGDTRSIVLVERASNHYFQRPDATHLRVDSGATSLTGYSVNIGLQRQGGEHWRGGLAGALTSPGYEVNDLGFSYRTDRRDGQATLSYLENRPGRHVRRWSLTGVLRSEHNYAWQPIQTFALFTGALTTPGYWTFNAAAEREFLAYDDRLTRGGPLALRPAAWIGSAGMASDGRRPFTADASVSANRDAAGRWGVQGGIGLGVKTSTWWNLRVEPTLLRLHLPAQYVATVPDPAATATYGNRYIFAPLDQTQVGMEVRLNVTFTPHLSLETYAQPLLSAANYGAAAELVAPSTYDFTPYAGAVPNLDFDLRSLRGNAVLRWEWRRGSTLYVAWQQRRSDVAPTGTFDLGRDRRALFDARPDDILLVKVNYWLNP